MRGEDRAAPDQAPPQQGANGAASAPKRSLEAVPARRQHKPRMWLEDGEVSAPVLCKLLFPARMIHPFCLILTALFSCGFDIDVFLLFPVI